MVSRRRGFLLWLTATLGCGLVAALGSFASARGAQRAWVALCAFCLAVLPGALLGGMEAACAPWLGPLLSWAGRRLGVARFFTRDPAAPRAPVVAFHAVLTSAWCGLVIMIGGSKLWLERLRSVENPLLRDGLGALGAGGLVLLVGALVISAQRPLQRAFQLIDQRFVLPLPASSRARRVLWFALPCCALAAAGLLVPGLEAGALSVPAWLFLALGVQIILHAALAPRDRDGGEARTRTALLTALALAWVALNLATANRILARSSGVVDEANHVQPAAALLTLARALTDVDRDGASALFGGKDCAPFSAQRGPSVPEIGGNGVDENCDGVDAKPGSFPRAPYFWGGRYARTAPRFDVLWVIIDALRADHTGLLDYRQPTTPNLDDLAAESLRFTSAYSQSPSTLLSIPSMLTGVDPGELRWAKGKGQLELAPRQRYLSEVLAQRGYRTGLVGALVGASDLERRLPGIARGFSWVATGSGDAREASSTPAALAGRFLAQSLGGRRPFFLTVYMPAPLAPYVTHGPGYPSFGRGEQALYDGEIADVDRHVGFLLNLLRSDPARWSQTVVIVSGARGQSFAEHAEKDPENRCHDEHLHVPLWLRIPGQTPLRIETPVGLVDIVPTVLEVLGLGFRDAPLPTLSGHSLLLEAHAPKLVPKERPLFCAALGVTEAGAFTLRRSVRAGDWKLLRDSPAVAAPMLFDLHTEQVEQVPVSANEGEPAKVARRLADWLDLQLTGNLGSLDLRD